ncbi:hypothetical protein HY409_02505 [Candidatus Gottesmanbacteria bacterium]|nr:hypothetical protein [Candidatus Gottesmanbacteria bacterium]
MVERHRPIEDRQNNIQNREKIGWYDVWFLLATSGLFGVLIVQDFLEKVQRYSLTIESSPAVLVHAGIPWSECYPQENFPDYDYNDLVLGYVMDLLPQLDPTKDTWRLYKQFLDDNSIMNPDGTVSAYVVPDVDLDGKVCGITI